MADAARKQAPDRRHDSLLRMADVRRRTGLSQATIYRREAAQAFPARVRLGPNSVAWYESDIVAWLAARDAAPARAMSEPAIQPLGTVLTEAAFLRQAPTFQGSVETIDRLHEQSVRVTDLVHCASGIYCLWREEVLIYVGQTKIGFTRIAAHIANPSMVFDAVSFIRCPEADLDALERAYIDKFLPEMNRDALTQKARRGAGKGRACA